ncbi:MmcQ/YjbR family DNA-binding protein [Streptomyces sp. WMMC940]|uniref:MmcQ/YjbR family DNA-binding protein n=1 Tax=Streptomyces sp. WMMC940 TaxID=3015153 RepID=UPI0022B60220|nr:MmcQ/YjbR family DNA-binding protein [Streptomyces sp. WMMC940]MCZ7456830.1 MmcQ/YjbR family DNA-binding protein [Streptomyces sp. WMMC940]
MAAPPRTALAKWEKVRSFALGLPGAGEEFPWGDTVVKVNKKIFVSMGVADGSHPLGVGVKLEKEALRAHALSCPGAEPSGYGLGKAGWVRIPLAGKGAPSAEVLCDWVEESYRSIATKRLVAELDAR